MSKKARIKPSITSTVVRLEGTEWKEKVKSKGVTTTGNYLTEIAFPLNHKPAVINFVIHALLRRAILYNFELLGALDNGEHGNTNQILDGFRDKVNACLVSYLNALGLSVQVYINPELEKSYRSLSFICAMNGVTSRITLKNFTKICSQYYIQLHEIQLMNNKAFGQMINGHGMNTPNMKLFTVTQDPSALVEKSVTKKPTTVPNLINQEEDIVWNDHWFWKELLMFCPKKFDVQLYNIYAADVMNMKQHEWLYFLMTTVLESFNDLEKDHAMLIWSLASLEDCIEIAAAIMASEARKVMNQYAITASRENLQVPVPVSMLDKIEMYADWAKEVLFTNASGWYNKLGFDQVNGNQQHHKQLKFLEKESLKMPVNMVYSNKEVVVGKTPYPNAINVHEQSIGDVLDKDLGYSPALPSTINGLHYKKRFDGLKTFPRWRESTDEIDPKFSLEFQGLTVNGLAFLFTALYGRNSEIIKALGQGYNAAESSNPYECYLNMCYLLPNRMAESQKYKDIETLRNNAKTNIKRVLTDYLLTKTYNQDNPFRYNNTRDIYLGYLKDLADALNRISITQREEEQRIAFTKYFEPKYGLLSSVAARDGIIEKHMIKCITLFGLDDEGSSKVMHFFKIFFPNDVKLQPYKTMLSVPPATAIAEEEEEQLSQIEVEETSPLQQETVDAINKLLPCTLDVDESVDEFDMAPSDLIQKVKDFLTPIIDEEEYNSSEFRECCNGYKFSLAEDVVTLLYDSENGMINFNVFWSFCSNLYKVDFTQYNTLENYKTLFETRRDAFDAEEEISWEIGDMDIGHSRALIILSILLHYPMTLCCPLPIERNNIKIMIPLVYLLGLLLPASLFSEIIATQQVMGNKMEIKDEAGNKSFKVTQRLNSQDLPLMLQTSEMTDIAALKDYLINPAVNKDLLRVWNKLLLRVRGTQRSFSFDFVDLVYIPLINHFKSLN
jgi:hypothetical protein